MKLPGAISENAELKGLALFLSTMLWLHAAVSTEGEVRLMAPVSIVHASPEVSVGQIMPAAVELVLYGPRIQLWQLQRHPPPINLDMTGVTVGRAAFPSLEKAVSLPAGVRFVRTVPSSVEVTLSAVSFSAPSSRGGGSH